MLRRRQVICYIARYRCSKDEDMSGTPVADLGGVRGVQMHPPLAAIVMYFAYITARVHQMIMQQWHAATTTTLMYQLLTDLQTFD